MNPFILSNPLPIDSVAVVFNTANTSSLGRELEKLADCEVVEVASTVQNVLREAGYWADCIDIGRVPLSCLSEYDWIFNLSETIDGSTNRDYDIAAQMEKMGLCFTGSGSQTLKTCADKAITKAELERHGIRTPVYTVIEPKAPVSAPCNFPVIVKPVHEDGSIGITADSVVRNTGQLQAVVERIHHFYGQAALVEEFIEGRDITISVLGNADDTIVLPPSEIVYRANNAEDFLTFAAKWLTGSPEYEGSAACCPCPLKPVVAYEMRNIAVRACQIMDCRDYARVDFRLRGDTPFVLEVNPNPCLNPHDSGFIRSAWAGRLSYTDVIFRILALSIRNARNFSSSVLKGDSRNEHQSSYVTNF